MKRVQEIVQSMFRMLNSAIAGIYGLMVIFIMICCIFFAHIRYWTLSYSENFLPAIVLLIFGGITICGIVTICKKADRECKIKPIIFWIVVPVMIFLMQIYFVWNYYVYTDWDVASVVGLADKIAHNESTDIYINYFSRYPNNLFLVFVFSKIMEIVHFLGGHAHEYFMLLCVQCAFNTCTGVLLAKIISKLFHNRVLTMVGYSIYFFLIGLSPWVSIPYSDSVALVFPILIMYIYVNREKFKCFSWFAIPFLSYIGYKIKPQTMIVAIAIMLITILNIKLSCIGRGYLKKVAALILGFLLALGISIAAVRSLNIQLDDEKAFGIKHFFMMGMNTQTMGVWSGDDVSYSDSFQTVEERDQADLQKAFERIEDMGAVGFSKQMIRKTLTNYNDGTFFWGGEGAFYINVMERNTKISGFLRGLYYNRNYSSVGKYNTVWINFVQMIWLTCLGLGILGVCYKNQKDKSVLMLSVIGLTIFELLFEARSRYLYAYVPLYILLAIYGVALLLNRAEKKK